MSLKIKMFAMYDHFPELKPINELDPHINCYSDTFVSLCKEPGPNIAMLLEPRSMIEPAYDFVYENSHLFRYIFTHDSKLLKLPQARMLNWADVWLTTDSEKNMGISLCTSPKDWCPLHHARLELYNYFKEHGGVDCFYGDWNNPVIPNIPPEDYLEHYKFSIIIENDIDDFWFTEKILNCFATKTVPIYVGAGQIKELFNPEGIIQVKNYKEIPRLIKDLNLEKTYNIRLDAIEENFELVKHWKTPWKERFFRDYGDLLEDMIRGK